jgi:hypothetical protein
MDFFQRFILLVLLIVGIFSTASTQSYFTKEDSLYFNQKQDTIAAWADLVISDASFGERQFAVYEIIKGFKSLLAKENSFHFKLDKLPTISQIYAPDNKFRVFTWLLQDENFNYRYYGLIQMNSSKLKMYPLVDYTSFIDNPHKAVLGNDRWLGALYYDILLNKDNSGKSYYTLFGWEGSSYVSTKKWMDVLWFNDEGEPRFGAPIFSFEKKDSIITRFILQYKQDASVNLKFNIAENQVIFDYLIPIDGVSYGYYFNYVPDGSYSAFKWEKGKWKHIEQLKTIKLKDGEFPVGNTSPPE